MAKVIRKLLLPYRASINFPLPLDAKIVHVDRDPQEFMHAGIWYETEFVEPEDEDEVELKFVELSSIYTGDPMWSGASYVGTVIDNGYAHHVICMNPGQM